MAVSRSASDYTIYRSFFYFDLSSIPSGKTVTAVSLLLTCCVRHKSGVAVLEGTQADTLTTADFDAFGIVVFASQNFEIDINEFVLNTDGIQYVQENIAGEAKICCRESDYDVADIGPEIAENWRNGCYYADLAMESYVPKLKITYK